MDWPVENRPSTFVYQEDIKYPESMFGDESKMKRAGEKVGYRFVKKKKSLGKKPGPMIMDMGDMGDMGETMGEAFGGEGEGGMIGEGGMQGGGDDGNGGNNPPPKDPPN